MAKKGRRRFRRAFRRAFYRVVQAVVPAAIRKPVGRAMKGPPLTEEEVNRRREERVARKREKTEAKETERAERAAKAELKRRELQARVDANRESSTPTSGQSAAGPDDNK